MECEPQQSTHLSRRETDSSTHLPTLGTGRPLDAPMRPSPPTAPRPGLPGPAAPQCPATCQLRVPAERRLRTRGTEARRRGALPPSGGGPVASAEPPAGPQQPVVFHAARAGTGPHARLGARAVQPPGLRAGLGPRPRARACGRSAPACTPEPLNKQKVCGRCTCCLHTHGCLEGFPGSPWLAPHTWGSVQRGRIGF